MNTHLIALFGAMFLAMVAPAWAHPFHTSTAEMEYNPASGRFEVSLKVAASDFQQIVNDGAALLESALHSTSWHQDAESSGIHPRINVAGEIASKPSKAITEKRATAYLTESFKLTIGDQPCSLEWIGMEDEITNKWLYFEIVLPKTQSTSGEMTLTNKVLCNRNSNQINTVVFISKAARVSLKTHEQATSVTLPWSHEIVLDNLK